MVRWDQGLKSAQEPVPGENWDRAAKQKPAEMWVFTLEMDAAVSDETILRF